MESAFVSHEVEGVGGVRARAGTSTAELAGAANYWHKQFLAAQKSNSRKWKDGFLTGGVSIAAMVGVVAAFARVFF